MQLRARAWSSPSSGPAANGAPQGLPAEALDASAGHALDLRVGVYPRVVGRCGRDQLGDRGRLAALREGSRTLGGGRARVAHRCEHGARARLDEDDRSAAPAQGLLGGPAQAEVDREPCGIALGQGAQPLEHPAREGNGARFRLDPALPAGDREQRATSIEEEPARAPLSRLERALEPRPEATRRERHGILRGEHASPGLVAPIEGESRRVEAAERVAGPPREVGERVGGVETSFPDGRQDEGLDPEGFEIGEGNDSGCRATRPRGRDGTSGAGCGRGRGPPPGAGERGVCRRRVSGQETLPPEGEVG